MARKPAIPDKDEDDDAIAFAEAMRGTRVLPGPTRVSAGPPEDSRRPGTRGPTRLARIPPSLARQGPPRGGTSSAAVASADENPANDAWRIRGDGIDARTLKRLRNGQFPLEARLDLHGLTRPRAESAVDRFLAAARAAQRRGLLIIHGRGLHSGAAGPILRAVVRAALTEGAHAVAVLAAISPAPTDLGGAGATLVWLRKS